MTSTIRGNDGFDSSNKFSGKNAIIDGGFLVWHEGTTQTTSGYGSDTMWVNGNTGSTKVHSRQTFTLGQTDVPGNPTYYSRTVVTSVVGAGNNINKNQRIEGVSTFSGETVTVSFWAKADAAKNIALDFIQSFGSGGSPSITIDGIGTQKFALTTAWAKYTATIAIPSISTKVLGTDLNDCLLIRFWFDAGSNFNTQTGTLGQQSGTFDLAQIQLEKGSVATEFENLTYAEVNNLIARYYRTLFAFVYAYRSAAGQSVAHTNSFSPPMRATPTYAQLSTGSPYAAVNVTLTTSNRSASIEHCTIYRFSSAAGVAQFSEQYELDARL